MDKISKTRLLAALPLSGYLLLVWFFTPFFTPVEYSWMQDSGKNICDITANYDNISDITAPLFLLLFGTPLLIAFIRDIYFRNVFKALLYGVALLAVITWWWWVFGGRCQA